MPAEDSRHLPAGQSYSSSRGGETPQLNLTMEFKTTAPNQLHVRKGEQRVQGSVDANLPDEAGTFRKAMLREGITKETTNWLIKEGFNSVGTFRLLTPHNVDELLNCRQPSRLPLDQVQALRGLVSRLSRATPGRMGPSLPHRGPAMPLEIPGPWRSMPHSLECAMVLAAPNVHVEYHDITDFVKLTTGNQPTLREVSKNQWGAANTRILHRLLSTGQLPYDKLPTYLAHTVNIHHLGQRYEWQSVLIYDRDYRKNQARFQFEWGVDIPYLELMHLRSKPNFA